MSAAPVPPASAASGLYRGWKLAVAVVFLLVMAAITARLGFWQLSRAAEKSAIAAAVEAGRGAGALLLSPATPETALQPWRPVTARGVWLPHYTVMLNNRNQAGRPGYWVVTPLCLSSPDAPEPEPAASSLAIDCERAVAVLRGWVPRPPPGAAADALPVLPLLPWAETIEGELLERVPRLFELTSLTGNEGAVALDFASGSPPLVQNLPLPEYAQATGLALLPIVVQQTAVDAVDGLQRDWAGPPVDVDQHRGYALQWFSFSAIALIALGVLLVQAFRSRRQQRG